jgi:NIPSNAP
VTASTEDAVPVLDVRTYELVPGGREELDLLFRERVLPMLRRWGIQVVAYGPSLDDDHYALVRAFASAAERTELLDAFYGSDEWRLSHREAVLALIRAYHVVVIETTPAVRHALAARSPDRPAT